MDTPLTNPFERINLVRDAALRGDPAGMGRAAFTPKAVSPEERKSWVERYLGDNPGPLGAVLHMVSNPMVLLGLVVSMRYPIAAAGKLLDFGPRAAAYLEKLPATSAFFQDFHQIFRGTPLPPLMDYVAKTHHLIKNNFSTAYSEALSAFEKEGGVFNKSVGTKIAASLDRLDDPGHEVWQVLREHVGDKNVLPGAGIPKIVLTPAEMRLREKWRKIQSDLFDEVTGHGEYSKDILKALKRDGFQATDLPKIADYFPHIESLSREQLQQRHLMDWKKIEQGLGDPTLENFQQMFKNNASKRAIERKGLMLPDPEDLKVLGLDPKAQKLMDLFDGRLLEDGSVAGPTRKYSLNLLKTTQNYVASMARMKGWAVPAWPGKKSAGELILAEYPKVAAQSPVKAALLSDTYIPFVRGQISQENIADSLAFAETRDWAAEQIKKLPIPNDLKAKLEKPLARVQTLSRHSVGNTIADWFYTSSLGGNMVSAVKNLSQTLLTTIPTIGPTYTGKGFQEVMKRVPMYTRLLKEGVAEEEAFAKAFKEFAEHDFSPGAGTANKMHDLLGDEEGLIRLPSKVRNVKEKVQGTLLMPFKMTERLNRLTAFYGGRAKFLAEGKGTLYNDPVLQLDNPVRLGEGVAEAGRKAAGKQTVFEYAANRFGIEIARMTQFGGGPLNSPAGIVKWWAPFRQFLSFPLRVTGFMAGPATQLGGTGSFNPGTLGRVALVAGATYEMGKHALGIDMSDALLWGALPAPRERGAFAPAPVPPFLQVIGAGLSSAATGDSADIRAALPLLVPGGVGLSRIASVLPGGMGAVFNKPTADYNNRTPDGKIAVMTGTGQLQGYYTPTQLFAKAVGIGDVAGNKERALNGYLLAQRDRIRDYRTRHMEAMAANDLAEMQRINADFKRAYPGIGDIAIKKTDVERLQNQRDMSRIDRILKTMPQQTRGIFAGVVGASLGADQASLESGSYQPFTVSQTRGRISLPGNSAPQKKVQQTAVESGAATRDDLSGDAFNSLQGYLP